MRRTYNVVQTWKMSSTHIQCIRGRKKKRYKNASVSMYTLRWLFSAFGWQWWYPIGTTPLPKRIVPISLPSDLHSPTIPNRLRTYTRPLCAGNEKVFSWSKTVVVFACWFYTCRVLTEYIYTKRNSLLLLHIRH